MGANTLPGQAFSRDQLRFYGKACEKSRKCVPIHWNPWIFSGIPFDSGAGKLYDCALMSKRVPDFVNPFRAAEGGHTIAGRVAFARMKRLAAVVENGDGGADVTLSFAVDEQGIPHVRGWVRGEVALICQRCLAPLTLPVSAEMDLGIVASDEEAKRLPAYYDPLLAGGQPLSVAELVEDELLLALPAIARHADGVCAAAKPASETVPAEEDEAAANPFAVLARLKSKH